MHRYKNHSGNSGVREYEIGDDYLKVKFIDNAIYLYTYASAGKTHVEALKRFAQTGKGLAGYISKNVSGLYASKFA